MKEKRYYVYAQDRFKLWALVYITENKIEAENVRIQYIKAKILKNRMKT
jgi:hypothetical protein